MNDPQIPPLLLNGLCFIAGFVSAIWFAYVFDKGAREIAEKEEAVTRETPP